jgi:DNA-binding GntR family transcriptional regulator
MKSISILENIEIPKYNQLAYAIENRIDNGELVRVIYNLLSR